jgi:hypothetical protein
MTAGGVTTSTVSASDTVLYATPIAHFHNESTLGNETTIYLENSG